MESLVHFHLIKLAAVNILEKFGSVVSTLQLCALAWPSLSQCRG